MMRSGSADAQRPSYRIHSERAVFVSAALLVGCGGSPFELVSVSGVVTLDGRTGDNVWFQVPVTIHRWRDLDAP